MSPSIGGSDDMSGQIHNVSVDAVYELLQSRPEGLEQAEVTARLGEIGGNKLEVRKGIWWLQSLARQFTNFFSLLLDISALICFVADRIQPGEQMYILGWALLGVSILNALFSFAQEYRAERAMAELRKMLPHRVMVRRGGTDQEVNAEELVPGDVFALREGDKVPADARLIEARDLMVNNAPLTGEARPLSLDTDAAEGLLQDSNNVTFAGCTVLRGSGRAVVFATGYRTLFGRIAKLSQGVKHSASPLEREIDHMVRVLTIVAVTMGLIFFAYGVIADRSLWVSLVFMMGIIVANVPEGLLPTFTLSLAMGSLRMARRNVLVKELSAVEAMGAVHVICTDKTGTLTLNQLTVTQLARPDGGDFATGPARREFLDLATVATDLGFGENGLSGDPLDVAIARELDNVGGNVGQISDSTVRRFAFDARRRHAGGIRQHDGSATLVLKGAWETLRPMVTDVRVETDGQTLPAKNHHLADADATVHRLASLGQRVIAIISRPLEGFDQSDELEALEQDMVLEGFIGLEDPIRPEVSGATERCREAGIAMIVITGDHPETAEAIARQAGILPQGASDRQMTVTGDQLIDMHEQDLIAHLEAGVAVFARTNPEQKMKIVAALHQMGRVVAVTGDGVNDAPALKAADVGIAMGRDGTDVAREAAQVILLDDNFASIVAGIEEGRTIFANIRKFTNYVLVSNGPEILPFLIYMLFPVPLALTVIQILTIDLGTDIIPSMALGQEKPRRGIMRQPPRQRSDRLMSWPLIAHSYLFLGLIEATFAMSLFFWVLVSGGWTWGQELASGNALYQAATGITLASILLMQIGNLFGRRSKYGSGLDLSVFSNPLIFVGVTLEIVISWAILYYPPLSQIMGTGPVEVQVYLVAWLGVPLVFLADYARKRVARAMLKT